MHPSVTDEPETPPRPTRPWCLFQCGRSAYAVGLESVAEVVVVERTVRLPQSPPRVLGLCTLRRDVIPVIGLDEPGPEPATHAPAPPAKILVLILRTARGTWGVRINPEGTVVAEEAMEGPAPPSEGTGPAFLGAVRRGGAGYAVLDPEATWRNVRKSVEDWYADRLGRETPAQDAPAPN